MTAPTEKVVDLTADLAEEDRALTRNFPRHLLEFRPEDAESEPYLALDEALYRAQLGAVLGILKDEGGPTGGPIGGEVAALIALGFHHGMWHERERNGLPVSEEQLATAIVARPTGEGAA